MSEGQFQIARDELAFFFAGLGGTIGLRGASLEVGNGIFDDHASNRLHLQHRDGRHRHEVAKMALVVDTLARIPGEMARVLQRVFTPIGSGRVSYRLYTALAWEGQQVVGVAVDTLAMTRLWEARRPKQEPTASGKLALLDDEVSTLKRGNDIPSGHRLFGVWRESVSLCECAAASYQNARVLALRDRTAKRNEARAAEVTIAARKMRGEWTP